VDLSSRESSEIRSLNALTARIYFDIVCPDKLINGQAVARLQCVEKVRRAAELGRLPFQIVSKPKKEALR
jgi:hypothetical protein